MTVPEPDSEAASTADQRAALDALFDVAYDELYRLASQVRRNDGAATITPTALVNEAWLKLSGTPGTSQLSRLHFRRVAARAMRQVLVEAARRRQAIKRGGELSPVTLDDNIAAVAETADDLLLLNEALEELARLSPRQSRMIELRFFAGLEITEVAEVLELSEATVHRDWRAARAWLAVRLTRET